VLLAPRRDRPIDAEQARVGPDEQTEHAQHDTPDDEDAKRQREEEPRLGGGMATYGNREPESYGERRTQQHEDDEQDVSRSDGMASFTLC